MMSKTDYEVVADAVASVCVPDYRLSDDEYKTVAEIVTALANAFSKRNPRFKRSRFVNACLGRPDTLVFIK
jgi:hypothetical protein